MEKERRGRRKKLAGEPELLFWHRLALKLGCGTVEELQGRMSSAEFTRWIAFSRKEPFDYEMENWRAAMIASAVVNAVHRTIPIPKGKRRPKPTVPKEFYPVMVEKANLTEQQAKELKARRTRRIR